jgi:hypothetical protein
MGISMATRAHPVKLPDEIQFRLTMWRGLGALGLVSLWGWYGYIKGAEVPVLQFLDIAVHEIGHRVFAPFGEVTMLMMGSGSEMLFPLVVGLLVFGLWKRDLIAWGICWAWAAGAFADASRYMADATQGQLMLLGGSGPDTMGDWERIFGPEHWDKMYLAARWAHNVHTWGLLVWFASLALVIGGIAWNWKKLQDAERAAKAAQWQRPTFSADPRRSWVG